MTVSGPRRISLKMNFSWMLVGNVVMAGCRFGMLMMLAKLTSTEVVGDYILALAVCAPIMAFYSLNLRAVQATDPNGMFAFADYAGQRCFGVAFALVTVGVVLLVGPYDGAESSVIGWMALAKAVELGSDLTYGRFQQLERLDWVARSLMIRGLVNLASFVVVIWFTGSLRLALMAQLAIWLAVFTLHDVLLVASSLDSYADLFPRFQWQTVVAITRIALPLGVVVMLTSVTINVPKYAIEYILDIGALGVFGTLAYIVQVGTIVVTAMGQAATPRLAVNYSCGRKSAFVRLSLSVVAAGAGLGVAGVAVAWLFGVQLITLLATAEYAEHEGLFVLVMVAGALSYLTWLGDCLANAARYFVHQVPLALVVFIFMLVGCVVLIPDHGLYGAAYAWIASQLVYLIGSATIYWLAVRAMPAGDPVAPPICASGDSR